MKIENIRGEFTVYIVEPQVVFRNVLETLLLHAGFNAKAFESAEEVIKTLETQPPHIIVSSLKLPQMTGLQLLSHIRQISDEILMVLITSDPHEALVNGAYDTINRSQQKTCLIPLLDRTIEKLYLKFQNEQLLEAFEQQTQDQNHKKLQNGLQLINQFLQKIPFLNTSGIITCFMKQLNQLFNQPVIYLRYLPSHTSLLLVQAEGLDITSFKNTGIPLTGSAKTYLENLKNPQDFQKLKEFMLNVFQVNTFEPLSVVADQNILGIIIAFDQINDKPHKDIFDSYSHIFKSFLDKTYFYEKMQSVMVSDLTTGAFNKKYCMKILDQEISRASRIKHPISLLYVGIDDFDTYLEQNGEQMTSILLKMLTDIFIKTSRKVDFVVRFYAGEFIMILPHTNKEQASIKAERLRRTISTAKFPYMEGQPLKCISISVGISEYPSIAQDATALIQVADNALYQIKKSTKNQVCLGKTPEGFEPDFKVTSIKT